jgi:hypothetical protein
MVWLSYGITGLVLFVAALVQFWVIKRGGGVALRPSGMDLLAKSFLDVLPEANAPLLGVLIWLSVGLLIDVGCPVLAGRTDVLNSWLQRMLAINYGVVAPLLFGCYLSLGRALRHLAGSAGSGSYWRRVTGFVALQAIICAVALASQHSTIAIQTTPATATPPILWVDTATWRLNWQGALHAALRGLDAVMGLGLIGTLVMVWVKKEAIGGTAVLDRAGGEANREIRRFAIGLLLAMALASVIAWLHLATIMQHRAEASPEPPAFAQFVRSGWTLWVIGWAIAAGFVGDVFLTLRRRTGIWPLPRALFFCVVGISVVVEPIAAWLLPIILHRP